MGLTVKLKRSCLVPSQSITFLCVALDNVTMKARPLLRDSILRLLPPFGEGKWSPYMQFLCSISHNNCSLGPAVNTPPSKVAEQLPLRHQVAQAKKAQGVRAEREGKKGSWCLSQWRERAFILEGIPMGSILFLGKTDASLSGWGAVWQNRAVQEQWSAQVRMNHVSVLELQAVHLVLQYFIPYLRAD